MYDTKKNVLIIMIQHLEDAEYLLAAKYKYLKLQPILKLCLYLISFRPPKTYLIVQTL
jgi:hypothetical protein